MFFIFLYVFQILLSYSMCSFVILQILINKSSYYTVHIFNGRPMEIRQIISFSMPVSWKSMWYYVQCSHA